MAHIVGRDHDASSWESLYELHKALIVVFDPTPRVTFEMDADVAVALGARTAEGSKASGAGRSKTAYRGKR
jgi:hypothetical protein